MQKVSHKFEVIVFTASEASYADPILDFIDPNREIISHRFYRHHCIETEKNLFVKDLRVLGQRPQEKTCIVDNALHSYIVNLKNGIPVLPFTTDKKDDQLMRLAEFLMGFEADCDVRKTISSHFCYKEFVQSNDQSEYIDSVRQKLKI